MPSVRQIESGNTPVIVARIPFRHICVDGCRSVYVQSLSLPKLLALPGLRAVLVANPTTSDILKLFALKHLFRRPVRVVLFDLILRRPAGVLQRAIRVVKSIALRKADLFLLVHKDASGYRRHYGVDLAKCRYVPFKANNLDLVGRVVPKDGDYVLSCGASQRDFDTLLRAVAPREYKTVIVLTDQAARHHNARLDASLMGPHVRRLRDVHSRIAYNELIACSRMVVVPIIDGTLQPAGISVTLEAMALGKPVIVTRGPSTEGVLDERMAVLVPPGNADAMREAIDSLWNSSARRQELGRAGRDFALGLGGEERMLRDIHGHFSKLVASEFPKTGPGKAFKTRSATAAASLIKNRTD